MQILVIRCWQAGAMPWDTLLDSAASMLYTEMSQKVCTLRI